VGDSASMVDALTSLAGAWSAAQASDGGKEGGAKALRQL